MKDLLTKSLALLFSLEGKSFQLLKYEPPFIYCKNTGVYEVCLGEVVEKGVEITPFGVGGDMPTWDWRVIVFIDKEMTNKDSANTILVRNDDNFKLVWDDAHEFAKTIAYKFWIDVSRPSKNMY